MYKITQQIQDGTNKTKQLAGFGHAIILYNCKKRFNLFSFSKNPFDAE